MTAVPSSRSRAARIQGALRRHDGRLRGGLENKARAQLRADRQPDGQSLDQSLIQAIAEADPTHCGTYISWLVRQWFAGHWQLDETERLHQALDLFDRHRHRLVAPGARDIEGYAAPEALIEVVRSLRRGGGAELVLDRPEMRAAPHARVLRDDAAFLVVQPLTPEAAAFWGQGSEWCVTWGMPGRHPERENRFVEYSRNGHFLFVRRHADASLWAFFFLAPPGFNIVFDGAAALDRRWGVQIWSRDNQAIAEPLKQLFSPAWEGLLQGDVLQEMARDIPLLGPLMAIEPHRRERVLNLCGKFEGVGDWRDAQADERRLGITLLPRLAVLLEDATAEERRLALGLDPILILFMPDTDVEERLLAIERMPSVIVPLLAKVGERERIAALQADPHLCEQILPLSPGEAAVVAEQCPDLLAMIAAPMTGHSASPVASGRHWGMPGRTRWTSTEVEGEAICPTEDGSCGTDLSAKGSAKPCQ